MEMTRIMYSLPLDHFFSFNGETSAVKADAQKIAAVLNKMVTVAGHEERDNPIERNRILFG